MMNITFLLVSWLASAASSDACTRGCPEATRPEHGVRRPSATPPVPRTADGKPDLSGVWQPGSDRVGTWEEANQGVGVPEPGRPPVRQGRESSLPALGREESARRPITAGISMTLSRAAFPNWTSGQGPLYPNQFVQTPKLIVILVESRHVFRLIPLNEKHPDDLDPSYLGDSVGRWEGDTLVVDVTGFKERLVGSKISTDALHIIERFTPGGLQHHQLRSQGGRSQGAHEALHHHQQIHVAAGHTFAGIRLRKQSGSGPLRAARQTRVWSRGSTPGGQEES